MYTANLVIICETAFIYFVVFLLYKLDFSRMYHEQEVNGSTVPVFHTDDFILKVTVAKVTEKLPENTEKVTENSGKVTENSGKVTEKLPEKPNRLTENKERLIEKLIEKAPINGDKLTEYKIAILTFMIEDTYISKSDLSKFVGINTVAISNNIEAMREKELCRVSPDKGGFWEIIE